MDCSSATRASDRFTEQHERLAVGVASWASVALENARMYTSVQEASRIKDDFLASLSHELRTPLNAILGYARMLRSGIVRAGQEGEGHRDDRAQRDVADADRRGRARHLADRLRQDPPERSAGRFPEIVRSAVDAITPAADAKGVRIETVLDPQAAPVSGDPDRLQQVLWNLLSNAVKFTNRGGKVQVRLERVNSHVEVAVSDTGIGIAPEFLPHVFERFRQADAGIARERGGLGLGLSIARQLTEMHGGTIDASSGGVDQGATFRREDSAHDRASGPRRVPRVSSTIRARAAREMRGCRTYAACTCSRSTMSRMPWPWCPRCCKPRAPA